MAKKRTIFDVRSENKLERQYGKYNKVQGALNISLDKKRGVTPTASFLRYAGGEMRAVSFNGGKAERIGASKLARQIETRRRKATGSYRGMKL